MKNLQKLMCTVIALCLLVPNVTASGKRRDLRGTIIAYDPSYHALKQPSFVKNLEVTIAEVGRKPSNQTFVKRIFEGFGTQQVADDILAGRAAFSVRAVRDTSCDEGHPQLLGKGDSFQRSGAFLLNEGHQTESLEGISSLACYRVQVRK
jgi:hypothetical protein